jgi:phage major head subunit gpT-like protein
MAGFDDRNIIGLFQSRYEELFNMNWARELSLYNPSSDRDTETYGIFGGFPKMRQWIGARQAQATAQASYNIRNLRYESTLSVPQVMLDRDKTGLLTSYVGNYAAGCVANHWEDLLIALINANGLCYDGQNYFDTDHALASETTMKNDITATEVPALDVTTTTNLTATEWSPVLMGLVGHMMTYTDDKGRYVNQSARKFAVAVSTVPLWTGLNTALTQTVQTGTVDNPLNGLRAAGYTFTPLFLPGLTSSTTKVRMFRLDGELKPFILQQEQDIEYEMLGRGSDYFFENHAIKLGVNASRGAGYGLWEHALQATFS